MQDAVQLLAAHAVILCNAGSRPAVIANANGPGILCIWLQVAVLSQKLFVYGLELVVLPLGDKHRTAHDRLRAVPLRLHGQEILPGLLATLVALNHAELFGHWDGQLMVVNRAFHLSVAFRLNSYIFVRVEIFTLGKSIFDHAREPNAIRCVDFQEFVQLPAAHRGALRVVVANGDEIA